MEQIYQGWFYDLDCDIRFQPGGMAINSYKDRNSFEQIHKADIEKDDVRVASETTQQMRNK